MAKLEIRDHPQNDGTTTRVIVEDGKFLAETTPSNEYKDYASILSGDVLLMGAGLGITEKFLLNNRTVDSVEAIELRSDILPYRDVALRTTIHVGDATTLALPKKYDCIFADVISDLEDKGNLALMKKILDNAFKLLKPRGAFLFYHTALNEKDISFFDVYAADNFDLKNTYIHKWRVPIYYKRG